jgi:hypothetical protein
LQKHYVIAVQLAIGIEGHSRRRRPCVRSAQVRQPIRSEDPCIDDLERLPCAHRAAHGRSKVSYRTHNGSEGGDASTGALLAPMRCGSLCGPQYLIYMLDAFSETRSRPPLFSAPCSPSNADGASGGFRAKKPRAEWLADHASVAPNYGRLRDGHLLRNIRHAFVWETQ